MAGQGRGMQCNAMEVMCVAMAMALLLLSLLLRRPAPSGFVLLLQPQRRLSRRMGWDGMAMAMSLMHEHGGMGWMTSGSRGRPSVTN